MTGLASPLALAKALALLVPAALLAAAYAFQYIGRLTPCPICYWQRWPHWLAIALAVAGILLARMPDRGRSLVWLAAVAILVSGAVGIYHVGVESGWFVSQCSSGGSSSLEDIMARSMTPCDAIPWADPIFGISMAGWNAIISIAGALLILWLSLKRPRNPALA